MDDRENQHNVEMHKSKSVSKYKLGNMTMWLQIKYSNHFLSFWWKSKSINERTVKSETEASYKYCNN
jgi:hypothetical protein